MDKITNMIVCIAIIPMNLGTVILNRSSGSKKIKNNIF